MANSAVRPTQEAPISQLRLPRSDWKRLNELLAQALAVEPDQRAAWLATVPDQHADLVAVLEQLLTRIEREDSKQTTSRLPQLRSAALRAAPRWLTPAPEASGAQIGPYRLLRELGIGGFLAVRQAHAELGARRQEARLAESAAIGVRGKTERHRELAARARDPVGA